VLAPLRGAARFRCPPDPRARLGKASPRFRVIGGRWITGARARRCSDAPRTPAHGSAKPRRASAWLAGGGSPGPARGAAPLPPDPGARLGYRYAM